MRRGIVATYYASDRLCRHSRLLHHKRVPYDIGSQIGQAGDTAGCWLRQQDSFVAESSQRV